MTPTDSPADQPTPDPAVAPASGATASPKASAPAGPAAMPVDTGEIDRLVDGAHPNPHAILGAHPYSGAVTIRVLRPMATSVVVVTSGERLPMTHEHRGVWVAVVPGDVVPAYTIDCRNPTDCSSNFRWRVRYTASTEFMP